LEKKPFHFKKNSSNHTQHVSGFYIVDNGERVPPGRGDVTDKGGYTSDVVTGDRSICKGLNCRESAC